ncbi:hypothetical protein AB4851_08585 [Burkholderia sp. 22PA0099]|uniref:hypothetical protein n=1 Tax=Burkholderia sp. 22PA0099 TaxID=3237372 RepID=UPI0039C3F042
MSNQQTTAVRHANLEGLRESLLAPREIKRDAQGWLTHPAMPCCDEDVRADEFLAAFRIEAAFVGMESDPASEAYDTYFERGDADCSAWTPTPPTGDGWMLLEIYDTEDGPYALFGRDRYEVKRAEKRANLRHMRQRLGLDAAPAAPVAEPMAAMPGERAVIDMLIALARATSIALDDSEEMTGDDGRQHVIDSANFDAVSNALDVLDELPDDKPGYTLSAAGKAEWALRNLGTAQAVAADVPHAWAPSRIWLQRGQGPADSHTWHSDSIGDVQEAEYVRVGDQAVAADGAATPSERAVIDMLIALTCATFRALDDSEEVVGADGRQHIIDSVNFDAVSDALDALDGLPDDKPDYTLDAGGKAEWALRNLRAVVSPATADERAAFERDKERVDFDAWYESVGRPCFGNMKSAMWLAWQVRASQAAAPAEARDPVAWMTLDCVNLKPSSVYLDRSEVSDMRPEHVVPLYRGVAPADAREAVASEKRIAELTEQVAHLRAVATEYNDLICHMCAAGDFHEFMADRKQKREDAAAAQGAQSEGGDR